MFWFGVISILLIVLLFMFWRKLRKRDYSHLMVFTGNLKTGKTALSLWFAKCKFNMILIIHKIKNFFRKLFKKPLAETPYFYSNIPVFQNNSYLKKYVKALTNEHLLRKARLNYKSVVYIDECSLVADSQTINDPVVNENLLLFVKLFAHETHGGYLFMNTQSILDCHYSAKRCVTSYIFIHKLIKLPFFLLFSVSDMLNSENGNNANVNIVNNGEENSEIVKSSKWFLVSKRIWKDYDCYAFSNLTDNIEKKNELQNMGTLKFNGKSFCSFKKQKLDKKDKNN